MEQLNKYLGEQGKSPIVSKGRAKAPYEIFQLLAEMVPPELEVEHQLVINLEEGLYLLDEKPVEMEEAPYMEEGVLMLPLRQMAELAGAEVSCDAKAR